MTTEKLKETPKIKVVKPKAHYLNHRDRVKSKILRVGTEVMDDYELLEALLFASIPRIDTKPVAKELLSQFGSLANVLNADKKELCRHKHVGENSFIHMKLYLELSKRILHAEISDKPIINSITDLFKYCRLAFGRKKVEELWAFYLDNNLHLIAEEKLQQGTVNHVIFYPREIAKRAMNLNASSMILVHNHPSGDTTPSKEDIAATKDLSATLCAVKIKFYDHVIISPESEYSMRSSGLL